MDGEGYIEILDEGHLKMNLLKSKWFKLGVIGLALTLTSCLYSGWQAFSILLLEDERYKWLCLETDLSTPKEALVEPSILGITPPSFCKAQREAIDSLFAISAAWEFFGGIAGGIMLDTLGPRYTACFGEILGAVAILLISLTPSRLQENLYHSHFWFSFDLLKFQFALTGLVTNIISYPGLVLEDYFDNAGARCAAFNLVCQVLSAGVAPLLTLTAHGRWKIPLAKAWSTYVLYVWIPIAIIYIAVLPRTRPKLIVARQTADTSFYQFANSGNQLESSTTPLVRDGTSLDVSALSPSSQVQVWAIDTPPHSAIFCAAPRRCFWRTVKDVLSALLHACKTSEFAILMIINGVLSIQGAVYQMTCRDMFGESISDFLGWLLPLQSISSLVFSRIAEDAKSVKMAIGILVQFALVYLLATISTSKAMQYINTGLFVIAISYSYNIKYTYVQEHYSVQHFGTLLGFTSFTGGLCMLAAQICVKLYNPRYWYFVLSLLSGASVPLAIYLGLKGNTFQRGKNAKDL